MKLTTPHMRAIKYDVRTLMYRGKGMTGRCSHKIASHVPIMYDDRFQDLYILIV